MKPGNRPRGNNSPLLLLRSSHLVFQTATTCVMRLAPRWLQVLGKVKQDGGLWGKGDDDHLLATSLVLQGAVALGIDSSELDSTKVPPPCLPAY